MFSSADNDILYQRQQASPDEFVSRPVRAIALCIPTVHHFRRKMHAHQRERKIFWFFFFSPRNACIPTVYHFTRKMHAHLRERKISCSFFSLRKKNYDRHVNGLGDLPFISLVCNRARSLKKNMFHAISNLGEKHRHSLKMKTCKSTCSTCTVVSHS